MDSDSNPPLHEAYEMLLNKTRNSNEQSGCDDDKVVVVVVEDTELAVINVRHLAESDEVRREKCKSEIAKASEEWGFFQIVNHGISNDVFSGLRVEREKIFQQTFEKKSKENTFFNFSADSYSWGAPSATCIRQLSWSEAFHIPLTDILGSSESNTFSSTIKEFATEVSTLAKTLADILAEKMGQKCSLFEENCLPSSCYFRLNRYPPCPLASEIHGLQPHTDSSFLTILHQDEVGGLQIMKDGKWIAVKPNPDALLIIIGDLFQAWSNGVYKSLQHRVVTNPRLERFSMAYFFCPSNDTVIRSCTEKSEYRNFSFGEYMQEVRDDVQKLGYKIGLPKFLIR
ncbi:aminocyclopropanecarboxylate oxidase [Vigna unguiculata]|uniref:Aminocyclopropanecarboxylate oxidase n=2 Tax=Vigna unguiculata TaxID=3917 RepID=A0A4D6N529_VIGUN|nr:aminocyclopropanecarboxylate oxidase [Vigna unguiculata]